MDLLKRKETIVLGGTRRGDSFPVCSHKAEYCLSELQRWARAVTISLDPKDRHEMLTLLLLPTRILCASTDHYLHPPTHTPGVCAACHCQCPVIQGQLPQENTWCTSAVAMDSAAAGSPHIPIMTSVPLPPPSLSEQEPPHQLLL